MAKISGTVACHEHDNDAIIFLLYVILVHCALVFFLLLDMKFGRKSLGEEGSRDIVGVISDFYVYTFVAIVELRLIG